MDAAQLAGPLPTLTEAAPLMAAAIYAAATLAALTLWRLRPRERLFAALAILSGAWLLSAAIHASPLDAGLHPLAPMLPNLALAGSIAIMDGGRNAKTLAAAAAVIGAVVLSALAIMGSAGSGSARSGSGVLLAGTLLCGAAVVGMLTTSTRRNWTDALTLTGIAVALLAALHDALRPLLAGSPFTVLLPFAGVLTLATLGTSGARRLLASFAEAETLNATLEDRIRAASAGLEASEAARRALEISTAITKERERLMREIHDGIGSSLVTTIAVSERLQKETTSAVVLKRALTDLRIAVDSLEPVQGNAATLLASLRYRVEPDFRRAGISFVWKVDAVPAIAWLDAVNALHVLRIFQEALGNIAIHSGASEVTVVCRAEDTGGEPGVLIEVRDNGKGLAATPESRGHGLDNMEKRARALGGRFAVEGTAGLGTSVSLWLPLRRADDW